jgi:hypothetical protein
LEAERKYFELIEKQKMYTNSANKITVNNLTMLLKEEELKKYLKKNISYGIPPHTHKISSRMKAVKIYKLDCNPR